MELHDGRIEVASTPGKGTAVTITIPAERVVREAAAEEQESAKIAI
jgi:signal transduction histidine kinase